MLLEVIFRFPARAQPIFSNNALAPPGKMRGSKGNHNDNSKKNKDKCLFRPGIGANRI